MTKKLYLACYARGRRDQVLLYDPQTRLIAVVSVNPSNRNKLTANHQVQVLTDSSSSARAGESTA